MFQHDHLVIYNDKLKADCIIPNENLLVKVDHKQTRMTTSITDMFLLIITNFSLRRSVRWAQLHQLHHDKTYIIATITH